MSDHSRLRPIVVCGAMRIRVIAVCAAMRLPPIAACAAMKLRPIVACAGMRLRLIVVCGVMRIRVIVVCAVMRLPAIAACAAMKLRPIVACAAIALCAPAAAGAQIEAFLLTSSPDSFVDLQAHLGAIGVVYPTYFECAVPGGSTVGAPNPEVDAYAAAHRLVEMPRYTCQNGAVVHRILTSRSLRARVLEQLATLAGGPAYAGLNLDLENDGARDRAALSSFVAALASRLHAARRRLAVDVVGVAGESRRGIGSGFYDDRALSACADTVFLMAWGSHWEGSAPGPIAPLRFVRGVARYAASLPHARRFVLGVPMYGLDWPVSGGRTRRATALQYAGVLALVRSVGATPVRAPSAGEMTFSYTQTGVPHRVWYMDARAILERITIARHYGLAAGLWRLGEEDQEVWSSPSV
jgi:spore germination protein YaaH